MLNNLTLNKKIRLAFDKVCTIVATVVGVSRDDQDNVTGVLLRTPQASTPSGTLWFDAEEITQPNIELNVLEEELAALEEAKRFFN